MRSLGFRAEADAFNWAVVEGHVGAPVLIGAEKAAAPSSYSESAVLSWCRDRVLFLFEQFAPDVVAVRYAETVRRASSQDSARKRCRVEGVLLEAANSASLRVVTGALVTISKHLGTRSAKAYLDDDNLRGLDWSKFSKNAREAILVAASALGSN